MYINRPKFVYIFLGFGIQIPYVKPPGRRKSGFGRFFVYKPAAPKGRTFRFQTRDLAIFLPRFFFKKRVRRPTSRGEALDRSGPRNSGPASYGPGLASNAFLYSDIKFWTKIKTRAAPPCPQVCPPFLVPKPVFFRKKVKISNFSPAAGQASPPGERGYGSVRGHKNDQFTVYYRLVKFQLRTTQFDAISAWLELTPPKSDKNGQFCRKWQF